MTREEAAKLLPIIKAFSEGREIETKTSSGWVSIGSMSFVGSPQDYRIKPSPTYRPFSNAEECWKEMQKHQPFGWMKVQGQYRLIVRLVDGIFQIDKADSVTSFKEAMRYCKFADGTPFGIKEEEE